MIDARLDVFVCGGSQLAASGLPPTAALPAQVARGLRSCWGRGEARVQPIVSPIDPGGLAEVVTDHLTGRSFAVVLVPRNVPVVLSGIGDAMSHLIAADVSLPPELPPRARALLPAGTLQHAWYGLWILTLPVRLARYVRGLNRSAEALRARGCQLFVVTTPVPFPRERSLRAYGYQQVLSALLRRWRGPGTAVAEVFGRLAARRPEPILPHDPHHLTVEGHRRAAEEIVRVLGSAVPHERLARTAGAR